MTLNVDDVDHLLTELILFSILFPKLRNHFLFIFCGKNVVEAELNFDSVDVTNLKITAHYTNIVGSIARGEGYYLIKTNNTETSNIESNENLAAVGTVTIDQHNGKTDLIFR